MNGEQANGVGGSSRLEEELSEFDCVFPEIVSYLTKTSETAETADAFKWYKQVLEYNVPYGKKNRGLTVVQSYKLLASPEEQSLEMMRRVRVLGWCVEILQAYFLVADDIMDQSETRRGQPCWYKKGDVGLMAVNDALFLENCIFQILHKYFHDHDSYPHLLTLFHQTSYHTIIGQTLDMLSSTPAPSSLDQYTEVKYSSIVKYKTAFYSFYLPVALAMRVSGKCTEDDFDRAKKILLLMGHYFQVQDDYLDCYGDVSVTGKVGTDIQEGKCSWLMVQACQLATTEQRHVLQCCYGRPDVESVGKVKGVYKDLRLEEAYARYEEESYANVLALIQDQSEQQASSLPPKLFTQLANKIYKRLK